MGAIIGTAIAAASLTAFDGTNCPAIVTPPRMCEDSGEPPLGTVLIVGTVGGLAIGLRQIQTPYSRVVISRR